VASEGAWGWRAALLEPAVCRAERCYAEWVVDEDGAGSGSFQVGVTSLDAVPPNGHSMGGMQGTHMHSFNGAAAPPLKCAATGCKKPAARPKGRGAPLHWAGGDRVGVLVEQGNASVFVNGVRVGTGPFAAGLAKRVGFSLLLFFDFLPPPPSLPGPASRSPSPGPSPPRAC
jgi:hypothetical protein